MKRIYFASVFLSLIMIFSASEAFAAAETETAEPSPVPELTPAPEPEYGGLRIDMSAEGEKGSFDVLIKLGGEDSLLPVPAGTQYLFRSGSSAAWTVKRVESSGAISLAHGETAIFTKLAAGDAFSVRETKNTLKTCTVSYYCELLGAEGDYAAAISDDGGISTLSGKIPPETGETDGEISATVSVTIENTAIKKP